MAKICTCTICDEGFMNEGLVWLHLRIIHSVTAESFNRYTSPTSDSHEYYIYENLASFLVEYACTLREDDDPLSRECYDFMLSYQQLANSALEPVIMLPRAPQQRVELIKLSLKLQCRNDPELRDCLRRDETAIVHTLQKVLQDPSAKDKILALPTDSAFAFLNLIDSVLDSDEYSHSPTWTTFRKQLRRISVRLCEKLHRLPESLHLAGVMLAHPKKFAASGGSYADIYKGYFEGRQVAVKTLRMFQPANEKLKNAQAFYREIAILHGLKHTNICTLLGVDRELFPGKICLVSPWMDYGNIRDFIHNNGFVAQEVHRLLSEIACGLAYLHQENVAHGDLRGSNILVDGDRHIKLTDFGLSNFADASQSSAAAGASRWVAPEVLDPARFALPHTRHTPASDVYSFGHVCWEIYNDDKPFPELHYSAQVILAVISGTRPARASSTREFPDRLWGIMEDCWRYNPGDRPGAVALKHQLRSLTRAESRAGARSPLPQRAATNLSIRLRVCASPGADSNWPETDFQRSATRKGTRRYALLSSTPSPCRSLTPQQPHGPRPYRMHTSPAVLVTTESKPSVRGLASVFPGADRLVPQRIYRPPVLGERVSACQLVMFDVEGPQGCGVSCEDAIEGCVDGLKGGDEFVKCPPSVKLHILWPDYPPWCQVLTLPGRQSRTALATRVSQCVSSFIDTNWQSRLNTSTGLRWKIGPGWIIIADLELVGLQPVAVNDWQVHLRVRKAAL